MDGFDDDLGVRDDEEVAAVISLATISDDTSPVVRLVNSTLYDALKLQASDIHLECDAGCLHARIASTACWSGSRRCRARTSPSR